MNVACAQVVFERRLRAYPKAGSRSAPMRAVSCSTSRALGHRLVTRRPLGRRAQGAASSSAPTVGRDASSTVRTERSDVRQRRRRRVVGRQLAGQVAGENAVGERGDGRRRRRACRSATRRGRSHPHTPTGTRTGAGGTQAAATPRRWTWRIRRRAPEWAPNCAELRRIAGESAAGHAGAEHSRMGVAGPVIASPLVASSTHATPKSPSLMFWSLKRKMFFSETSRWRWDDDSRCLARRGNDHERDVGHVDLAEHLEGVDVLEGDPRSREPRPCAPTFRCHHARGGHSCDARLALGARGAQGTPSVRSSPNSAAPARGPSPPQRPMLEPPGLLPQRRCRRRVRGLLRRPRRARRGSVQRRFAGMFGGRNLLRG